MGGRRGAEQLLVPTIGDAIKEQLGPACRVVSMSFKDRSAVLLGGARADLALWINLQTGRYCSSTAWVSTLLKRRTT